MTTNGNNNRRLNISRKLREARIIKEYTISKTAELAGIDRSTYSRYERGDSVPNANTLAKLIKILDIDANELFRDEDPSRTVNAYVIK